MRPRQVTQPAYTDEMASARAYPVTVGTRTVPVMAERLSSFARALYVPTFVVAGVTGWIVWVAVTGLERNGALGRVLSSGRAELAAPGLVVLIVAALACEQVWPAERRPALARGHIQDACFLVLYAAAVVPLMTLLGVGFATLIGGHAAWMEVAWTASWPNWLVVGLTLVAMDGANWLAHYADHRLVPLWRLHAVHHTQEELSVLTSFRAHPLVHTTGFLLATVPVMVLMGHRSLAPVLITTYVCLGTLAHANVRWRFGPLGRIVVSPAYHRLHHAADGVEGVNLGIVFTIWDVLAGKARFPLAGAPASRTGLAGRPLAIEQTGDRARPLTVLARQLLGPFAASAGQDGGAAVSRQRPPWSTSANGTVLDASLPS
jgi:sterol desaturase/sphingolipid hydroxylase (fatty acid hydroxylase superfamily)